MRGIISGHEGSRGKLWERCESLRRANAVNMMSQGNISLKSDKLLSKPKGFTLIELLVVIAIIGILAAIAIPQFAAYRARGLDAQMKSDVKNAVLAMESYYTTQHVYPSSLGQIATYGFHATEGVSLAIDVTSPSAFAVTASKPGGSQPSFTYDSVSGQIY